ncbi:unnamed protein product [Enterobius vermicularis]|uniref:Chitin-binding type-2 domain-containing protein n=1 Tax=Enterobius vermicularis TaxID=51028 RepID=A0A0N4UY84_ENTVE|nr:unnamed protein product [Enterobius vermicularis]
MDRKKFECTSSVRSGNFNYLLHIPSSSAYMVTSAKGPRLCASQEVRVTQTTDATQNNSTCSIGPVDWSFRRNDLLVFWNGEKDRSGKEANVEYDSTLSAYDLEFQWNCQELSELFGTKIHFHACLELIAVLEVVFSAYMIKAQIFVIDVLSCYKDPTTETCRNLLAALIRNAVLDTQNSIVAKDQEDTVLQRDRLCYGAIDEYYLACPDGTPPIHLVPFCLGYQMMCSQLSYPAKKSCKIDFPHYQQFCTSDEKISCEKSSNCSGRDYSCYCEPYACLQRRYGVDTAAWCQRFELFCNAEKRTEKSLDMIHTLKKTIAIHKHCLEFLNVAKTICVPFR